MWYVIVPYYWKGSLILYKKSIFYYWKLSSKKYNNLLHLYRKIISIYFILQ